MQINGNSSAFSAKAQSIRRIQREWNEIKAYRNSFWTAGPIKMEDEEDELYEWHFTLRGPPDSEFEGGIYHGRIILPSNYPFGPPNVVFLTPNGRFEINAYICLSVTGFHPEEWQPAWSIRGILDALHVFLPTSPNGAVNSLDWSKEARRELALRSVAWTCPKCRLSNETIVSRFCDPIVQIPTLANKSTGDDHQFPGTSTPPPEPLTRSGDPSTPDSSASTHPSPSGRQWVPNYGPLEVPMKDAPQQTQSELDVELLRAPSVTDLPEVSDAGSPSRQGNIECWGFAMAEGRGDTAISPVGIGAFPNRAAVDERGASEGREVVLDDPEGAVVADQEDRGMLAECLLFIDGTIYTLFGELWIIQTLLALVGCSRRSDAPGSRRVVVDLFRLALFVVLAGIAWDIWRRPPGRVVV